MELSERGCIELVKLLQRRGKIDVVHSLRQGAVPSFVTRAHLVIELRDLLEERLRLELSDLPGLLGVGSTYAVEAVETLCGEDASCFIAQSELFHGRYFDEVLLSIEKELEASGVVVLGDISARTGITLELLLDKVLREAGALGGQLDESSLTLYTLSHVERVHEEVATSLKSATQPLKLDMFRHGLPVSIFSRVVDDVISTQDLRGSMNAGSNTWTPAAYVDRQRQHIHTFWADHGYLGKEFCTKHGLLGREWKAYVKSEVDPGAIDLGEMVISKYLVDSTLAVVGELLEDDTVGYCDLRDLAPVEMTTMDVELASFADLLVCHPDACASSKVSDVFLVSDVVRDRMTRRVSIAAAELGKASPLSVGGASSAVGNVRSLETNASGKRGKRKEGRRKGRRREGADDTTPANDGAEHAISELFVLQCVLQECPELASEQYQDLASGLADALRQVAIDAFNRAQAELASGAREGAVCQLSTAFNWLCLYRSGHALVFGGGVDESADTYDAFLMRTTGQQCIDALSAITDHEISMALCESIEDFVDQLLQAAEEVGVLLKGIEPSTEEALTRMHSEILSEKLKDASDAPSALAAAVPLLVLKRMDAAINIPGKALSRAIRILSPRLGEDEVTMLDAAFDRVIRELTGDAEADEESAELIRLLCLLCETKNL